MEHEFHSGQDTLSEDNNPQKPGAIGNRPLTYSELIELKITARYLKQDLSALYGFMETLNLNQNGEIMTEKSCRTCGDNTCMVTKSNASCWKPGTPQYHVSKLRVQRQWLKHILEQQYGKEELIWMEEGSIPYYLRIYPYKMPESFGGKWGYKVEFFSVCCKGSNHFGNISTMMDWLGYMFGIVSVP